jgi:hypothetical protein
MRWSTIIRMDTTTINSLLKNIDGFVGTYPRDMIPLNIKHRPSTMIVNTHTSDKPGEHWVSIVLNKDGSGEYFDSYGLPPLHDNLHRYLNKMCPLGWGYNPITLQCLSCITCGHYCVLYVKLRTFQYSYCDFISLFSKNLSKNEEIIRKYVPLLRKV